MYGTRIVAFSFVDRNDNNNKKKSTHQSKATGLFAKEAQCYANTMGFSLDLSHPHLVCKDRDGKDISCKKVKNELS